MGIIWLGLSALGLNESSNMPWWPCFRSRGGYGGGRGGGTAGAGKRGGGTVAGGWRNGWVSDQSGTCFICFSSSSSLKKKLFFFGGNKKKETKWKIFFCMEYGMGMGSSATTSEPLSHENVKQGCVLSHFWMRRGVYLVLSKWKSFNDFCANQQHYFNATVDR